MQTHRRSQTPKILVLTLTVFALVLTACGNGSTPAPTKAVPDPAPVVESTKAPMLQLKRAKYLKSAKGQHGGYRLAKPADKIMLAEIIRLIDGALAPTARLRIRP